MTPPPVDRAPLVDEIAATVAEFIRLTNLASKMGLAVSAAPAVEQMVDSTARPIVRVQIVASSRRPASTV